MKVLGSHAGHSWAGPERPSPSTGPVGSRGACGHTAHPKWLFAPKGLSWGSRNGGPPPHHVISSSPRWLPRAGRRLPAGGRPLKRCFMPGMAAACAREVLVREAPSRPKLMCAGKGPGGDLTTLLLPRTMLWMAHMSRCPPETSLLGQNLC